MTFQSKDKATELLNKTLNEYKKEYYEIKVRSDLFYVKDIWNQGESPYREIKYAYIIELNTED